MAFLVFHLECSMTADAKKPESFERSEELQARFRRLFRREMTAEEKRILLRDYKLADLPPPTTKKKATKLRTAGQPPLSYRGAAPDSDRAKKPRLAEPPPSNDELNPGDRVEGLGNFGKPTGDFGTIQQTNEEDAIVEWDGDGRTRLHKPWLKKI